MPFQLRVEARRQFEVTEQVAYATVNVLVARNEFEPRFTSSEFRRDQLSERVEVGTSIITVRAEDRDGVRIFKQFVATCSFFYIRVLMQEKLVSTSF